MPRFDNTGPWGLGPRTGRGLGPCGRGYGYRRFASPRNEKAALDEDIAILEEELKTLKEEKAALEEELKDQK